MTDASHCPKTYAAGFGFWVVSARRKGSPGGGYLGVVENPTLAEMMAVSASLWKAIQIQQVLHGDYVLIQTDCQPAIDKFTMAQPSGSLKFQQVLAEVRQMQVELALRLEFRHVKGHTKSEAGNRYAANNMCDIRAKQIMRLNRDRILREKSSSVTFMEKPV